MRLCFTNNLVGVHDGLQAVCDSNDGHIPTKFMTKRRLDYRIRFIICQGMSTAA
jgi:hypothetical protein